jgi:hypothetical protein
MARTDSRPVRWARACESARTALADLETAFSDLRDLQDEYQEWLDNLPEVSQGGATAEKLEAMTDLDLDPDLGDLESALDEAEGADLPLGFGRD